MENGILEMAKKFEEFQRNMFVEKEYINGDVQNFVKALKEINVETQTDIKNQNLANFVGKEVSRLELISQVLKTRKIIGKTEDYIEIGKYLKELGDEFIEFGKGDK